MSPLRSGPPRSASGGVGRARVAALFLLGLLVLVGLGGSATAQTDGAVIDVVEVHGVIDGTVAGYLRDTIARAERDGAALVAVSLDAPGGVSVDVADLVEPIRASRVPVLVYVGDAGAVATGAGALLAQAAHVLAASPVTQVGVTYPVDLGAPGDRTELARLVADLAEARGRDPQAAAATVTDDRVYAILAETAAPGDVDRADVVPGGALEAVTPAEATERGIVDLVEPSLSAALDAVSGRTVTVAAPGGDPERVTLAVDGATARVRFNDLGLLDQLLTTVADPTIAYVLLIAGTLAIAFEIFQPGFGVAGVSGAGMAAAGLYGLTVLPVRWWAFAVLVAGLVVLTVDLAMAGLGLATLLGAAAVTAGSFLLFDGPPLLQVSPWVVVPVAAFTVLFFVVIMTTVLRAQGNQAMVGAETVVGKRAVVRSMLNPEGHVFVDGALWRARAPDAAGRVKTGTVVRIVGLNDQLTLDVELEGDRQEARTVG